MGNHSIKSSENKNLLCCLCTSSFPIDDKSDPTFNRISTINDQIEKPISEDLKKSSHHDLSIESIIKSNREFNNLIKKFQLSFYLTDYFNRLKTHSKINQTFKTHFSSTTIIYPCNGINQVLTDDLHLFLLTPPESILPKRNNLSKIHEQIRSKCYFIPLTNSQIEPDDEEYQQKRLPIDRTHVVITLENNSTINPDKISLELDSSCVFTSNNSFQTGLIRINQEKIAKELLPFIYHSPEDNLDYLSSDSIQKWFNTLILVNQTCVIAKRFLMGDKNHITCLLKEQGTNQENFFSSDNNLIFAALRLPSCTYFNKTDDEKSEKSIDGFSPEYLSDNEKLSHDYIHIDYEQYSFAFILSRWPKFCIDNYYTQSHRYSTRQWPSKDQMNIIIRKSLLLIPDGHNNQWKISFDSVEEYLFDLMNESTLVFYILCQQLFAQTYSKRILIKHCFLNYLEKYGLPFSKRKKTNLSDLITYFLKDLSKQMKKKYLPDYFNHQRNLLHPNEDYNQWFDYIDKCLKDRIYFSSPSFPATSDRSIMLKFLFDFTDQFFQTFRRKQPEFHLNDSILLDLHRKLSHHDILIDKQTIENIQTSLTYNYEINAELIHICLNQIRRSQTSLIFHYTWTIFIQYLHTYYNVLWNLSE